MSNRPYDESVDAIDGDEIVTPRSPDEAEDVAHHKTPITGQHRRHDDDEDLEHEIEGDHPESPHDLEGDQQEQPREASLHDSHDGHQDETDHHESGSEDELKGDVMEDRHIEEDDLPVTKPNPRHLAKHLMPENHSQEVDDENDSEDEHVSHHAAAEGLYDPAEFQHLPVGSDIKELFQFIPAYTAQVVETDNVLKPFILDYIPSVGDIDAFIKVPRPDDVEDNLGLVVLDEPAAKQSDPTVLDLQMRAVSKGGVPKTAVVKKLARADKNTREIENWMKNISELHKSKPATNVHYSKPMPDIDTLMQEWPTEFENILKQVELPTADMDLPLEQYVDLICSLLDIPVHKSRIQSLHVLFTLYSEFKNSQHFKTMADDNQLESQSYNPKPEADTLVL